MGKVVLIVSVAVGVLLAGSGGATAGKSGPTRDYGRGHWIERVCAAGVGGVAACGAQVVTDADGVPLASSSPPPGAYGPAQFHTGYSLPTVSSAASAPTIAIVDAYDDPHAEADLATFDAYYGLPACTTANGCFLKVDQNGGTNYPHTDAGWALEISLDVQVAHEICQNCRILLVEATTSSLANLGAAENTAARLGASAISNSWGTPEYANETLDDGYFNHPGIAITASSGDSGYGVEYPAASRYVTATGGTTLSLNADNTYRSESAWNGAGSGCSLYESKPSWQTDTACEGRTVADVAADADPNTGRGRVRLRAVRPPVRLVPGRRHEPLVTAGRRCLRPRGEHRLDQRRRDALRTRRLLARRHDRQQRQLQPRLSVHSRPRVRRAHRSREPERDERLCGHARGA